MTPTQIAKIIATAVKLMLASPDPIDLCLSYPDSLVCINRAETEDGEDPWCPSTDKTCCTTDADCEAKFGVEY